MVNKIGVCDLVGFILRSGDLATSLSSMNTAQTGSRIHRKLQRKQSSDYQAEFYLEKAAQINGHEFLIHGRADGVILRDQTATIEEIKTSDIEFKDIPENKLTLYWGQAQTYAYLLMNSHPELDEVKLHLTYVQTPDEIVTKTEKTISKTEATKFFNQLVSDYEEWLQLQDQLNAEKVTSTTQLTFPFGKYRAGQHELAAAVYKSALLNKHLFAEAPTGTGKTISTLFPAVKVLATEKIKRIFYLTAKQSTRRVAEEAIGLMSNNGLKIRSITLTAKDKIKFPEEQEVAPEENPYMIGYYDRLKPALKDLLLNNHQINRAVIEKYARQYTLDPFEFSLDASLFCDIIIGDYNHLFDPKVHLQRFFEIENKENFYLIDEAHNLVDRSREMYSANLSNSAITDLLSLLHKDNENDQPVITKLRSLQRNFKRIAKPLLEEQQTERDYLETDEKFTKSITNLVQVLRKWLAKQTPGDVTDKILDFFFQCTTYLKIDEYFGPNFKFRVLLNKNQITVRLFCMDPSPFIADTLNLGGGAVLFSATLSPMKYYTKVLGDEPESLKYQLPSPFDTKHQKIIITSYIDTTYNNREQSLDKIISSIYDLIKEKKGNYLIFAPSNVYLEMVYDAFKTKFPEINTICQKPNMDDEQRTKFLQTFNQPQQQPVVGFALLGGLFSEGIDLVGDKLIGVGIVGVGLPGLNTETNLIRDYFDADNGHGFEYAYQLPGLNNVFQAAGRLIRGYQDQGIILLMDRRFTQRRYTELFPPTWRNYQIAHNLTELQNEIKNFWKSDS
ncbi:ATP-dependent helicase [Fructilactobacillus lindneri]|uniref:ATP-dependent DNA helicase n=1 Tax=Fructilactobacillus lindneri TaxID=53444 RepID=UPI0006D1A445|nr:ATP-dependent DNA helicase [Fructilactobacillus lindneri]POH06466.1 ATP-dependent helicase [Fructilactobacillus lindneri]POH06934.1 ATP-dependent helicase [Fructilactobacillus lindneri]POH24007.1 ATP-dependent helicase [Fructilactobacillus lindneri DSM 20690 = JCM 11027]